MSLKLKFALLFSLLVSIILFTGYLYIYLSYSDFRKDEFYLRLEQKGLTTYRLLFDVKEIDEDLLRIIDRNTINQLYDEKVLIFNDSSRLIYSSIDDHTINYSNELLKQIKENKQLRFNDNENEVLALSIKENGNNAYVVISAYDKFGKRKLNRLKLNLFLAAIITLILTIAFSYLYVNQLFKPVQLLSNKIRKITDKSLNARLETNSVQPEFIELANSFNQMLERLNEAFKVQKNFVNHASHELRTPLANLLFQTETALNADYSNDVLKQKLRIIHSDIDKLVQLTNALLLLSQFNNTSKIPDDTLRIDEIIYKTIDRNKFLFPDFNVKFDFKEIPEHENDLLIKGNETLLTIAFGNLIRNACTYALKNEITISISIENNLIALSIYNDGKNISPSEQNELFNPFFRAENSSGKSGSGIGLAIVQRIIKLHKGTINYKIESDGLNCFEVKLSKEI